ncbi:MAG: LytTR family transcriptional regulator [Saprospiraceae bacterium]|uniref:LytTR family transcriptional regulator DNA-binding domain-containing protein n=1 Tax=Candidatus Brachybacter algidus TaxID=2982024 RepID=UPI00338E24AF|nr:LytTR family transcriptional regulator [Candidatus Brachybacter algidus]
MLKYRYRGSNYYDYIEIYNIIRCEGWQKYTRIHLKNNTSLLSSYNLGVFRELLSKYAFIDVHKSHLINKKHISKYLNEELLSCQIIRRYHYLEGEEMNS